MTDNELRGLILKYFYDRRREQFWCPRVQDLGDLTGVSQLDIYAICDQLAEHCYLEWTTTAGIGNSSRTGVSCFSRISVHKVITLFNSSLKFMIYSLKIRVI